MRASLRDVLWSSAVRWAVVLYSSRWLARSWSSLTSSPSLVTKHQMPMEPAQSSQMKREPLTHTHKRLLPPASNVCWTDWPDPCVSDLTSFCTCSTNKHYQKLVHAVGAGQGTHKKLEKYHPNAPRNRPKETVSCLSLIICFACHKLHRSKAKSRSTDTHCKRQHHGNLQHALQCIHILAQTRWVGQHKSDSNRLVAVPSFHCTFANDDSICTVVL